MDLTGAELANSRRQQSNNNNSTLSDNSTQILREIRRYNRNLSRESNVASEAIAELYQLPKRPFSLFLIFFILTLRYLGAIYRIDF